MGSPIQSSKMVEWDKIDDDGTTVYIIEYAEPVTEPTINSSTLFGTSSGGIVPADDRQMQFPDGKEIPADELVFDADGNTLRARHEGKSLLRKIRRTLFPWW